MGEVANSLQRTVRGIGDWAGLDRLSDIASGLVEKVTGPTAVRNLLSGTWLGHQLHPMLTDLPIGAWGAAAVLDLTAGEDGAESARRMVGLGLLSAVPAAASGANDWSTTYGPDKRIGFVHALANLAGTTLQFASWTARRNGRRGAGIALTATGLGFTLGSAYLGGHLSLSRGVGVNHAAFQEAPEGWTDVAAESDLDAGPLLRVTAGEVPVVLIRRGSGIEALSAVCSHAGGPLDEGTLDGECLICPWHGSAFRTDDGSVQRGPATIPQTAWDTKRENGRVFVRPSSAG